MKEYKATEIRNVVVIGHGSSGKTSVVEALLHDSGATNRLGRIEEGNTVSDYDAEEIERQISVNLSLVPIEWKGHKINLLDTPGYADFVGEVKGGVRVADTTLLVVDAVAGVEVGTELVWSYAEEEELPRMVFINRMNRENANFDSVLQALRQAFEANFVPLQFPLGQGHDFQGVVDLVAGRAYFRGKEGAIPEEAQATVDNYRQGLMEAAAEADDELILKYLGGEELTAEDISRGLRGAIIKGKAVPVLCGSATENVGLRRLLDGLVAFGASPLDGEPEEAESPVAAKETLATSDTGPLAVLVFKTLADPFVGKLTFFRVYSGVLTSGSRVHNSRSGAEERLGELYVVRGKEHESAERIHAGDIGGVAKLQDTRTGDTLCDKGHPLVLPPVSFPHPVYSAAIAPKTKADLDKMGQALSRSVEEDPTLQVRREAETGETILSGMGESHIDITIRRLQRKFGVEIITSTPRVPYRETIRKTAQAQGRYKRQTGGRGQYGDVWIRYEPLARGAGFEFVDEIFGGSVPKQYIPATEKGLREAIQKGVLAGYPTADFRAVLYGGSFHAVDSSEMAFKIAASLSFKKGMEEADPVLLEPVMNMTIIVPEQYMGDVLGDLNSKRAKVLGMEQRRGNSVISAQAPLAEVQRYATDLRSITQGRGVHTMEFSHYEEVPAHIAQHIIDGRKRELEAAKA